MGRNERGNKLAALLISPICCSNVWANKQSQEDGRGEGGKERKGRIFE
jgi:hypothetical protein